MIVSDEGQARVFLINVLFGIICVVLFDLFGVMVKKCGKRMIVVNLLDTVYFVGAFLLILYAGVKYNFGALRYYQILGLLFGMGFWYGFFSRADRIVFEYLIEKTGLILKTVVKIVGLPVLFLVRAVYSPLAYIEEKVLKLGGSIARKRNKIIKKHKKNKKTMKKRKKMI